MSHDACTLPAREGDDEFRTIDRLVRMRTIAVVGLSDDPARPSFEVASYLLGAGKTIIPVNPTHRTVLGLRCYASLEQIPQAVELVNVFRRAEFCGEVARSAVKIGAKGLWLQSGIRSADARQIALSGGLGYVEDRCLMVEMMHHKHM